VLLVVFLVVVAVFVVALVVVVVAATDAIVVDPFAIVVLVRPTAANAAGSSVPRVAVRGRGTPQSGPWPVGAAPIATGPRVGRVHHNLKQQQQQQPELRILKWIAAAAAW